MTDKNKTDFGRKGEDIASKYLESKGFTILARNVFLGHGEIDIIAEKSKIIVFVEVRTKSSLKFGLPELSLTKFKKKQIFKLAEAYIYMNNFKDYDFRLDFISVLIKPDSNPEINHYENLNLQ